MTVMLEDMTGLMVHRMEVEMSVVMDETRNETGRTVDPCLQMEIAPLCAPLLQPTASEITGNPVADHDRRHHPNRLPQPVSQLRKGTPPLNLLQEKKSHLKCHKSPSIQHALL
jgi:hypothetical protein